VIDHIRESEHDDGEDAGHELLLEMSGVWTARGIRCLDRM